MFSKYNRLSASTTVKCTKGVTLINTNYSPLLADFYQFTMAYGYWKLGKHEQEAVFHLVFRRHPFKGQYALCAGLESVVAFLTAWRFDADALRYLQSLPDQHGNPLFNQDFIDYLANLHFTCDIDAIPEGNLIFANAPILRVKGPLIQCQLIESALLNLMNFQTLIATKASRVCEAADGDPVIEFGLRRAQGPDGALSASRAAYIGGCVATSNTLAGYHFGIPVRGTHAHSWVTAFASEIEAFTAYASILPQQAVLLVDTYNTLEGVKHAIETGKKLREHGADLLAIRLDSGDMVQLSREARALLDAAGFEKTSIMASNSLDEHVIRALKQQGAKINLWGVGTHLTTAYDQPALDGVYKMGALKNAKGEWEYRIKLSEQEVKISNPGQHQVRRYFKNNQILGDLIYDINTPLSNTPTGVAADGSSAQKIFNDHDAYQDLLQPVMKAGLRLTPPTPLPELRETALASLAQLNASPIPVYLEKSLHEAKLKLIDAFRAN